MPQPAKNVNPDTDHRTASLHTLALLIRPGNLDRVRDRLDPSWAHPQHRAMYQAVLALPRGTTDPLQAIPTTQGAQIVQAIADIEPPASIETGLTWLHSAWAEAELSKALLSGDPAKISKIYQRTQASQNETKPQFRPLNVQKLLELQIPEREMVVDPVIPQQGLILVYGPRGIAKTWFVLSLSYGIAAGGSIFGTWGAPKPRKVVVIDGEMPARTMQERIASIVAGSPLEPDPEHLTILTPDLQERNMPNVATTQGQADIAHIVDDAEVIVLDNLACLARNGRENEAESWLPVQSWLLELRRKGKTVILVHHAGKGGAQRGTSSREDILDTVIALKRPEDYEPSEGARAEVHLEKARGVFGAAANPFEIALRMDGGAAMWLVRSIEDVDMDRVCALKNESMSLREIAQETGMSKSKVQRLLKKAGMQDES